MDIDYGKVPGTQRMLDGVQGYLMDRRPPGRFLRAVMENNLREAVFRADSENLRLLPEWLLFFTWEVPSLCWGSEEKYNNWISGKTQI